jgi:capsule biosynthesis phosphatase
MKKLVIDLDGTLTLDEKGVPYPEKKPNLEVVAKVREYQSKGFEIIISTARNMRTHKGNVGKINIHTLPIIIEWLENHSIPFDEIIVGKPWCGFEGFYIDDKAIRPSEFSQKSYEEIIELLAGENSTGLGGNE